MRASSICWADFLVGPIARLIVRDIFGVIDPKDRDYFRSSRETWLSMTLEQVRAGREERLAAFREMLMPIRLVLRQQDWLGGPAPSYTDHIVAGTLMWPRCSSKFPLLADDDPVAQWFGRMLDQYGGLGRTAKTPNDWAVPASDCSSSRTTDRRRDSRDVITNLATRPETTRGGSD